MTAPFDDGTTKGGVIFNCIDPYCPKVVGGILTYGTVLLPVGLPLLLARVGAFAALRRRTKFKVTAPQSECDLPCSAEMLAV